MNAPYSRGRRILYKRYISVSGDLYLYIRRTTLSVCAGATRWREEEVTPRRRQFPRRWRSVLTVRGNAEKENFGLLSSLALGSATARIAGVVCCTPPM
jgi:hypothetical protein